MKKTQIWVYFENKLNFSKNVWQEFSFNSSERNINETNNDLPLSLRQKQNVVQKRDIGRNAWCIKLQKSWISYKTVHTYVDMKNLLCISSGKEWKSQGKSFCRKNTLSEMYVIFWKELGHQCQKMFKSFRRHSEVPKNQEWRIFIVLT